MKTAPQKPTRKKNAQNNLRNNFPGLTI